MKSNKRSYLNVVDGMLVRHRKDHTIHHRHVNHKLIPPDNFQSKQSSLMIILSFLHIIMRTSKFGCVRNFFQIL